MAPSAAPARDQRRGSLLPAIGPFARCADTPAARSICTPKNGAAMGCHYGTMRSIVPKTNRKRKAMRSRVAAAPSFDARASNAGDRYHLVYVARRALEMLHPSSDLKVVALENVAPEDQNVRRDARTFLAVDVHVMRSPSGFKWTGGKDAFRNPMMRRPLFSVRFLRILRVARKSRPKRLRSSFVGLRTRRIYFNVTCLH